jgi:hypothetical protein
LARACPGTSSEQGDHASDLSSPRTVSSCPGREPWRGKYRTHHSGTGAPMTRTEEGATGGRSPRLRPNMAQGVYACAARQQSANECEQQYAPIAHQIPAPNHTRSPTIRGQRFHFDGVLTRAAAATPLRRGGSKYMGIKTSVFDASAQTTPEPFLGPPESRGSPASTARPLSSR